MMFSLQAAPQFFTFHAGRYQVRSPWWALTLVLLMTLLFGSLATWQISRYFERTALLHAFEERMTLPPIAIQQLDTDWESQLGQPLKQVVAPQRPYTVLLDNQMYQGAAGYRVFNAVKIDDHLPWLWVDRGWIPLENGREQIPMIPDLPQTVELTGLVDKPMYNRLVSFVTDFEQVRWPLRIQTMDIEWLSNQIGVPFYPWVLLVDEKSQITFKHTTHTPWLTPMRHQVYALQWLSFILLTWGFWGRFTIRKKESS